ncbi:regulator of cell morphogenesis and NO signaling [Tenacibaculum sp. MAR_2009_124]|uniref:DUF542 domain-containing protein n=1 Tax=Tenacibaculum sp. MAR_2009_124 TaxID=1250059 RepID=UPI00089916EA|nr:DUF542 domain-containing protein [Tenacibaculum sp. MAR_2009_124]SEB45052.1 regulator of cell morphogenesis and NO signaling [Tenacibaculum sp. MAR_2009_124]
MVVSGGETVSSVVVENIKTSEVFMKYGIDYYCKGNIAIEKVCKNLNIIYAELKRDLSEVATVKDVFEDYNKWSLDFLIIYIENMHHSYIKKSLPDMLRLFEALKKNRDVSTEEISKLNCMLVRINELTLYHLKEEKEVLFPCISKLVLTLKNSTKEGFTIDDRIRSLMNRLKNKRVDIARELKEILQFLEHSNALNVSNAHCKILQSKLQEFQRDLQRYFHLDNNILEPKVIQLEKELSSK